MVWDRGLVPLIWIVANNNGTSPARANPVVHPFTSLLLFRSIFLMYPMSSTPGCKNLVSTHVELSHCAGTTAGQPSSCFVPTIGFLDWNLIPDVCNAAADAKDAEIPTLPVSLVNIVSPSPRRQHRPRIRSGQDLIIFFQDQDTPTVDLVNEGRPASFKIADQAPPKRPSPRRLPTPDLPDLDEQKFWPALDHVENCHATIKGGSWFKKF